ncbi:MAG: SDR family oxidoreductase, partial [Myxococcota bacterium]
AWHRAEDEADPRGFTVHPMPPSSTREALVPWSPAVLDARRTNSWSQTLAEIDPWEMMEVHVVNAMAPFLVCSRLFDNLCRSPHPDRYIVNVTAVEGQFTRETKSVRHPHTNMAKAALNMLTCTSASDYANHGVFMTAVDPGWMSDEGPPEMVEARIARGFRLPLTARDCAARILHPVREGLAGRPRPGVLLKDFEVVPW